MSSLALGLTVYPGAEWVEDETAGWAYKDGKGFSDGVRRVFLEPGTSGQSSARVDAKGQYILMPLDGDAATFLGDDP